MGGGGYGVGMELGIAIKDGGRLEEKRSFLFSKKQRELKFPEV
jgi:hypothetical protein